MNTSPSLFAVITSIQRPTPAVRELHRRLTQLGGRLIVAGDRKGPPDFDLPGCDFLSLTDQQNSGLALANILPVGHYARKNIAYLYAIRAVAACTYETDDDNAPLESWAPRSEMVASPRMVSGRNWINVFRYFTDNPQIWPRGFPLERLADELTESQSADGIFRAPVQQGLVNGSPDVDAVWRLTQDRPFDFEPRAPVALAAGQWCPFNTQSTWWWPVAYPLLYVPSYCSFRMCDIWKSFVAQRCLWALGTGVVYHAPEVFQDRNPHDYLRDFQDEVPGYLHNSRIADILSNVALAAGEEAVAGNLLACYEALIREEIFPVEERPLVQAWIEDCAAIS
ncbi:MAG: DUF288 domain-containing protein [Mollicutes bacterium]|nr:DUF288 domain-containing protein [Mollicutes bacterium]